MKPTLSVSKTHLLVSDDTLRLYSRPSLALLCSPADVTASFLHDLHLFLVRHSTVTALSLPGLTERPVLSCKSRVSAVFATGSFLYVGTESGTVHVLTFNELVFCHSREYRHQVPVFGIASDNIVTFVTDYRDRVTEYPSGRTYDMEGPRVYYGGRLYCTEGRRLYVRTKEAFGLLATADEPIENVFVSELGGYVFVRCGAKTVMLDGATGEACGELDVGPAVCMDGGLVCGEGGGFGRRELPRPDKRMEDPRFRAVEIKEHRISPEEYEKRHAFIDDGHKAVAKGAARAAVAKENQPNRPAKQAARGPEQPVRRSHFAAEDLLSSEEQDERGPSTPCTPSAQPSSWSPCRSVVRQGGAALLFYSAEGHMLAMESAISNFVSIKYHDSALGTREIKDPNKCTMGCFSGRHFLLSNHSLINFNDEWSQPLPSRLIALSGSFVFVLSESCLRILDFGGSVRCELYAPGGHCMAASEDGRLAVFLSDYVILIESVDSLVAGSAGGRHIPLRSSGVDYAAYSAGVLYVRIGCVLYRHQDGVLVAVCEVTGQPVAVVDNFVLTLAEPVSLLPRPSINYNEMHRRETGGQPAPEKKTAQYNIYGR